MSADCVKKQCLVGSSHLWEKKVHVRSVLALTGGCLWLSLGWLICIDSLMSCRSLCWILSGLGGGGTCDWEGGCVFGSVACNVGGSTGSNCWVTFASISAVTRVLRECLVVRLLRGVCYLGSWFLIRSDPTGITDNFGPVPCSVIEDVIFVTLQSTWQRAGKARNQSFVALDTLKSTEYNNFDKRSF